MISLAFQSDFRKGETHYSYQQKEVSVIDAGHPGENIYIQAEKHLQPLITIKTVFQQLAALPQLKRELHSELQDKPCLLNI